MGLWGLIAMVMLLATFPIACGRSPRSQTDLSGDGGFQKSGPEDGDNESVSSVQNLIGTMTLIVPKFLLVSTYWVYVDGRIVAVTESPTIPMMKVETPKTVMYCDLQGDPLGEVEKGTGRMLRMFSTRDDILDTISIKLVPGRYTVELAVRTDYVQGTEPGRFPLMFKQTHGEVEAGKTCTLQLAVPPMTSTQPPVAERVPVPSLPGLQTDAAEHQRRYLERLTSEVDAKLTSYQADPVVVAVQKLRETPLVRPIVYMEFAKEQGGAREIDAQQIRLIVAYLKEKYWGWFPKSYSVMGKTEQGTARFHQLAGVVAHHRKSLDQCSAIAERLQELEPSRK
jgi:hypothetical protein